MAGVEHDPSVRPQNLVELDRIQSNCGLFAVVISPQSARNYDLKSLTLLAGASLQHRAEGGAGYAVFNEEGAGEFVKGPGRIDVAFREGREIPRMESERISILHTRYPTAGGSDHSPNVQPLLLNGITMAHHGNYTNADVLRDQMGDISMGGEFPDNDSWIGLNLVVRAEGESLAEKVVNAHREIQGGWATIITDGTDVVATRDPQGIRPLFVGWSGHKDQPDAFFVSVETAPFNLLGITEYRDILPGETVLIKEGEVTTVDLSPDPEQRSCVFEMVYMMHPDSRFMGEEIFLARREAGHALWREQPVEVGEGDKLLVMPVPDSGRPSAKGFFDEARRELGDRVEWDEALLINRYVGRNFIKPTGSRSPSLKFFEIPELIVGRTIVLVDDSLVRGETIEGIVKMLLASGVKDVHVRLASPPIVRPCHWGVAMNSLEELAAIKYPDVDDRAKALGMKSLGYLSLDGLFRACGADEEVKKRFCAHCFGGASPRMNGSKPGTIPLMEPSS